MEFGCGGPGNFSIYVNQYSSRTIPFSSLTSLPTDCTDDDHWDQETLGHQIFDFTCPSLSIATVDDLDSTSGFFNFFAADSTPKFYSEQPLPRDFLHGQDPPDANPVESKLPESKLPPQSPSVIDIAKGFNMSTKPSSRATVSTPSRNNTYAGRQLTESPPEDAALFYEREPAVSHSNPSDLQTDLSPYLSSSCDSDLREYNAKAEGEPPAEDTHPAYEASAWPHQELTISNTRLKVAKHLQPIDINDTNADQLGTSTQHSCSSQIP